VITVSRTRTLTRWLRRTAVIAATTLALVLVPVAAYAAGDTSPAVTETGGAVTVTTKVIAAGIVLGLGWRRGTVLLVLFALAAGVMLGGSSFGTNLANVANNLIVAGVNAVSGVFA
jgi:hypothetical protein